MAARLPLATLAAVLAALASQSSAQFITSEINPVRSALHPTDNNAGSGGRVTGLAADRNKPDVYYAATEWGGLYKSNDRGLNWDRLDGHLPTATWDVAVNPIDTTIVIATSMYDGRRTSLAGISRSTDGGVTWSRSPTVNPPPGSCANGTAATELSGYRIAFDPNNAARVFVATNCGIAASTNVGATWTYVNPRPAGPAQRYYSVIVHGPKGIIDVCGDVGHLRSVDGGVTWSTARANGIPLPGGVCSLAASPHEPDVLFAVSGTQIFETADGGGTWNQTYANPAPQGRVPFVATNWTGPDTFDLWFGDVQLYRTGCQRPAGGVGPRCPASTTWTNVIAGAHWDSGAIVFDPRPPTTPTRQPACPVLFGSDGGVYRNTLAQNPTCQTPQWDQPQRTPRSLWLWNLSGTDRVGGGNEDVHMLAQDNGAMGTQTGAAVIPAWNHTECCDGFSSGTSPNEVVYAHGAYLAPPAIRLIRRAGGMAAGGLLSVANQPPGGIVAFNYGRSIATDGANGYVVLTGTGLHRTANVNAPNVVWNRLGNLPATQACSVTTSIGATRASFFVQSGTCDGRGFDRVFRFDGLATTGTWTEIAAPNIGVFGSRFGQFAVDPTNPERYIASVVSGNVVQIWQTRNGGANWTRNAALEQLMTGGGQFVMRTTLGPRGFLPSETGYAQPTFFAISPLDPRTIVAGSYDAGVFLSGDGGTTWRVVTDNSGGAANPVIPRIRAAHFEWDTAMANLYLGTQGRGGWRIGYEPGGLGRCALDCRNDRDTCLNAAGAKPPLCTAGYRACLRRCQ